MIMIITITVLLLFYFLSKLVFYNPLKHIVICIVFFFKLLFFCLIGHESFSEERKYDKFNNTQRQIKRARTGIEGEINSIPSDDENDDKCEYEEDKDNRLSRGMIKSRSLRNQLITLKLGEYFILYNNK